ncbi:MAG: SUMF1/EgtB/PvdO family nonheme iron enzyme [Planctomycetes bacterium]|nr:SUMF1/EgtB/PvdO family nonheme iron enzyme [Planctomycetota bacterium]
MRMMTIAGRRAHVLAVVVAVAAARGAAAAPAPRDARREIAYSIGTLERAVRDLRETFGPRYPRGAEFLARLEALGDRPAAADVAKLAREALLANPLLTFDRLLVIRRRERRPGLPANGLHIGMPSNHECNSSLPRDGWENEIAILSLARPDAPLETLYRPPDSGYVGEMDLRWDADRILFTRSDAESWKIWEIRTDGSGLRQVSTMPGDVDCMDPCYLPGGGIVFGSTASYQSVPCWHGLRWVTNLYRMDVGEVDAGGREGEERGGGEGEGAERDGTAADVRQLCFDQDHDFHPAVLPDGRILFNRWDYTGPSHIFLRELMVMNPDGTGQRAVYGSNSWFPNSLYFSRPLPGETGRFISILSGYHGVHRMGQLVIIDADRGWEEAAGIVRRISGRGDPIIPKVRDNLVDADWPKFLHPFPLSETYFVVACQPTPRSPWGIYLADVFDNLVLVREEPGWALLEPVPLAPVPRPPVIPDRTDPARDDAVVYLHDVHAGPGLAGMPRGSVTRLRIIAYHFGYRGLAGPDKIGYGGPWEAMRIIGTVPLDPDGSACFRVPAKTPLAVQALDAEGKAVQLMRSWFTAQPGEVLACVGCHERPADGPAVTPARAARRPPREIDPWYGSARGFDFAREVEPVLEVHCANCHDGARARPDLRPERRVEGYAGHKISDMGIERMHPRMRADTHGILRYTPAYEALLPYIRRVNIEDDVSLLVPGEYHVHTSPLIQMLRKGHGGIRLGTEAWDRIVTWIDLNTPCHGTWGEVYPIPDGAGERRMELRRLYGGPADDPETVPASGAVRYEAEAGGGIAPVPTEMAPPADPPAPEAWTPRAKRIDLGGGVGMDLVLIPAGAFTMGDPRGEPDERPLARVAIARPFWMGACEVSNEQLRRFDPEHDSHRYVKRHGRDDDDGLPLDDPRRPAVRVSWERAMAFCRWLSASTSLRFRLPTEAEWEWACRAGAATPLAYGEVEADFSPWANVADRAFTRGHAKDGRQVTGGLEHLVLEGAALADARFDDGAIATAPIGSFRANAWGLHDMHGNAAEWTASAYAPYPYRDGDGRNDVSAAGAARPRAVRGGSFFDPPARCRSAFRLDYPPWQRVFNVGFRVVCEVD